MISNKHRQNTPSQKWTITDTVLDTSRSFINANRKKKTHQSLIYSSSTDTGYYISSNYEILTNVNYLCNSEYTNYQTMRVLFTFIFRSVWCYLSINNSSFDDNNYSEEEEGEKGCKMLS